MSNQNDESELVSEQLLAANGLKHQDLFAIWANWPNAVLITAISFSVELSRILGF